MRGPGQTPHCPTCAEKDAEITRLRDLIMLPKDREAMLVARATAAEAMQDVSGLHVRELTDKLAAAEQREAEKDTALRQIADHDHERYDWSSGVAERKPSPQEIAQAALASPSTPSPAPSAEEPTP